LDGKYGNNILNEKNNKKQSDVEWEKTKTKSLAIFIIKHTKTTNTNKRDREFKKANPSKVCQIIQKKKTIDR